MIRNLLQKCVMLLVVLCVVSSMVYSDVGFANVVLSSQDPDPVSPGNFVDLSFKVSNPLDEPITNVYFEFLENEHITLASFEDDVKFLGVIPAYSSESSGFTIIKFRAFVTDLAPIGEENFEIKMKANSQEIVKKFTLNIKEESPSVDLQLSQSIEDVTFKPGEQKGFELVIKNFNSISIKDIKLTLDTSQDSNGDSNDFYVLGSTNVKRVNLIQPNEEQRVVFNLGISPTASIQPYQIPVSIEYEDVLGNSYTEEVLVSIIVNAQTELLLSLDKYENSRVTFGLANPGPGVVKGAFVRVYDSNSEEITTEYIGDLNADDFQTIQFDYELSDSSETVLVDVVYSDGYYVSQGLQKEFVLQLDKSSSSSNSSSLLLFLIIGGVVGYFVVRRVLRGSSS